MRLLGHQFVLGETISDALNRSRVMVDLSHSGQRTCLEAAGASITDVVRWTILCVEGASLQEGFAAFGEFWPRDAPPPAITFAFVAALAVPGALVEIEAVAAVPS